MSLDTRDKRASVVALGLPWLLVAPTPDSAVSGAEDRRHVAGLYRGPYAQQDPADAPRVGRRGGVRLAAGGGVRVGERGGVRTRRSA